MLFRGWSPVFPGGNLGVAPTLKGIDEREKLLILEGLDGEGRRNRRCALDRFGHTRPSIFSRQYIVSDCEDDDTKIAGIFEE
jgi:hypothetical protein